MQAFARHAMQSCSHGLNLLTHRRVKPRGYVIAEGCAHCRDDAASALARRRAGGRRPLARRRHSLACTAAPRVKQPRSIAYRVAHAHARPAGCRGRGPRRRVGGRRRTRESWSSRNSDKRSRAFSGTEALLAPSSVGPPPPASGADTSAVAAGTRGGCCTCGCRSHERAWWTRRWRCSTSVPAGALARRAAPAAARSGADGGAKRGWCGAALPTVLGFDVLGVLAGLEASIFTSSSARAGRA